METEVDEVLDEITRTRQRMRAPSKREALRRLRNHVGEPVAMIRYRESRANGTSAAVRPKGDAIPWRLG